MTNKIIATIILLMFVAGCTMIPEYKSPGLSVNNSWPVGKAYLPTDQNGKASDIGWKDYFKSDNLTTLIKSALEENPDLRIAVLNIERAKAAYRIQRSGDLPAIAGAVSGSRAGVPENVSATGKAITTTTLSANVGVAYELDFFGRIRSLNQKALETYLATEEAFVNTRISLIAETANAYLIYLAYKKLLLLAENTSTAQEGTYDVIKHQYEVGSAARLDLAQAATSVESAKVSVAQYTRLLAQAKNTIVMLAGISVDDFQDSSETIDNVKFMKNLPAGLPSSVLTARPDIRQAEYQLKAANADIGAARAALYPKVSLTGAFGLASNSLSSLFTSGAAYAWNFTPSVSIPIFNRGRLKASLDVAEVNEKIAAAKYETAIRTAFKEVADQLAARGTYKDQLEAQTALVAASKTAYELSTARFSNGIDDFLTVLDSQRSLFAAEQNAVMVKQAYLSNLITMYKVLGGGQL